MWSEINSDIWTKKGNKEKLNCQFISYNNFLRDKMKQFSSYVSIQGNRRYKLQLVHIQNNEWVRRRQNRQQEKQNKTQGFKDIQDVDTDIDLEAEQVAVWLLVPANLNRPLGGRLWTTSPRVHDLTLAPLSSREHHVLHVLCVLPIVAAWFTCQQVHKYEHRYLFIFSMKALSQNHTRKKCCVIHHFQGYSQFSWVTFRDLGSFCGTLM